MSFLNKIKNKILGQKYYPEKDTTGVHKKQQLFEGIIQALRHLIGLPQVAESLLTLYFKGTDPSQVQAMISLINQPDFQEELDVALKNAQINLPPKWIFEAKKVQEFPEDALIYAPGEIGVILSRIESLPLQIRTQTGQTKESVTSLSKDQRVNIGRGEESLQANGQWVKNGIIFLNEGDDGFESAKGNPNEKVSRAHAYVEYDPDTYQYKIAAYPGGLPPRNKTQILRANIKISLSELAQQHSVALQPGDQIRLGDEVILLVEVENEATPESTTPNPSENEQI